MRVKAMRGTDDINYANIELLYKFINFLQLGYLHL